MTAKKQEFAVSGPIQAPLSAPDGKHPEDSKGLSRPVKLVASVFEAARLEWEWVDVNPCRGIRKPA